MVGYGGKDLQKRKVLSLEWKSEGVMDDESGESTEPMEEVPLVQLGEAELEILVRGWRRGAGSWFQRRGEAYWKERSVIRREDNVDGRASVTKDAPTHALNHLLAPTRNRASLTTRGHSYQLPEYSTDLHKKSVLIRSSYSFVKWNSFYRFFGFAALYCTSFWLCFLCLLFDVRLSHLINITYIHT